MIGTILLQRSEGGALGLGGGGGVSSLMSGRGAANALSRSTVICAAIFLATSLALAMVAKANSHGSSVVGPAGAPGRLSPLPGLPNVPRPMGPTPGTAPISPAPAIPAVPVPSQPAPAAPAPASAPPSGAAPAPASGGGH